MKLRAKILSTYLCIAIIGVLFVGILSSWQIRNYLEDYTKSNLTSQVKLLATLFTDRALRIDSTASGNARLKRLAEILGVRITIIRKDGIVVFDSEINRDSLAFVQNHLQRPEMVRAKSEGFGWDRRYSQSVNTDLLYAAHMLVAPTLGDLDSGFVRTALPTIAIDGLDDHIQAIVGGVGLATIAVITFVSLVISKRISKPILKIAEVAQAIKNGELNQRIETHSNDEIARLSTAINEMAAKLNADITQLKKLERVRSEFLGNVSHELRTPIFSIQGFLETLLDGAIDDPTVNREFVEKAHRHAERLNTLLNDLIEISRIESGEMKMSFRYFSVDTFVRQVVDEMRADAERKQISIEVSSEVDGEEVYGDRVRLKQVMTNLIDNAIKYTEPGGSITIVVTPIGKHCRITVKDTGSGIPAQHLSRIFERFYRVDKDRSREVGGTGLGLAIVKHIVESAWRNN